MFRIIPTHIKSLFHRLPAAFEKAPDKRDSMVISSKLHTINFNDTGIALGTTPIFDIEADATHPVYIRFLCYVDTVFNAGTTNVLTMGSDLTTALNVFAGADINEAVVGMNGPKYVKIVARTKFYVNYAQTGGAATTGKATFIAAIEAVFDK